jgi:hypothetical protein
VLADPARQAPARALLQQCLGAPPHGGLGAAVLNPFRP